MALDANDARAYVYIDGERVSPKWNPATLVGVAGFTIKWGRKKPLAKVPPTELELTIIDPSGTWASTTRPTGRTVSVVARTDEGQNGGFNVVATTFYGRITNVKQTRVRLNDPETGEPVLVWAVKLTCLDARAEFAQAVVPGDGPSGQWPSETALARANRLDRLYGVNPVHIASTSNHLLNAHEFSEGMSIASLIDTLYSDVPGAYLNLVPSPLKTIDMGASAPADGLALKMIPEVRIVGGEQRRNLATNPSFEAESLTPWAASGTTAERSTEWARSGIHSVKVVTTGTSSGSGDIRLTTGSATTFPPGLGPGVTFTMSAWINTPAAHVILSGTAASRQRRIVVFVSTNGSNFAAVPGPQGANMAGVQRLSQTYTIPANATGVLLAIGCAGSSNDPNFVTYVDDVLLEAAPALGEYFDGSTPDTTTTDYSWVAAENASASVQKVVTTYEPPSMYLAETDGCYLIPARWLEVTRDLPLELGVDSAIDAVNVSWTDANGDEQVVQRETARAAEAALGKRVWAIKTDILGNAARAAQVAVDAVAVANTLNDRFDLPTVRLNLVGRRSYDELERDIYYGINATNKPVAFPGSVLNGIPGVGTSYQVIGGVLEYADGWAHTFNLAPAIGEPDVVTLAELVTNPSPTLADFDPTLSVGDLGLVTEGLA